MTTRITGIRHQMAWILVKLIGRCGVTGSRGSMNTGEPHS